MDANFDYSDDEEYTVDSDSESVSDFESELDVSGSSDSDDSEAGLYISDSASTDSDDDLQFDYLCVANPPSEMEDVEGVTIEQEDTSDSGMVGYTLCGDNIDKNVRRRYQRSDKTTISLHYFHMYAVKNRVDFTSESDDCPSCTMNAQDKAIALMPTIDDDQQMRKNISIHMSRVLCTHMEFFKCCLSDVACWHMKHKYYKEMSTKSHVVSIQ